MGMQHIPLEIVCLGINQARPGQDVRCRTTLKIKFSQAISTTEGNLCGTKSARYWSACAQILPLVMPSRRPSSLVKHRFRPANFSGLENRLTAQPRCSKPGLRSPLMVAASTTLVCAAIWMGDPTTPHSPLPVCPTKALLGIDCPGCRSLQKLYSLMHGNLLVAAMYNALGPAAVLLVLASAASTYVG